MPTLDMPTQASHISAPPRADIGQVDIGQADTDLGHGEFGSERAIRVVLTDDRDAMRDSLRHALGGERDLEIVADAPELPSVVRRVHGAAPQVLVLNLGMPGQSSIEMLRRLHRQLPQTRIVVRSASDDPVFARRALDAGATSIVGNGIADVELPQAIRSAAHGERYLSPDVCESLASLQDAAPAARLTPRELEVLRLIALGYTSVEVAGKLDLSPRTIETHRARIHRKLKVATRAGLVAYALEHGLVTNGVPVEA
jgi:two-component system response regulator NreC